MIAKTEEAEENIIGHAKAFASVQSVPESKGNEEVQRNVQ